jgi:hypothetical protein
MEVKEQYQIKHWERFAALENLNTEADTAWKSIEEKANVG